MGFQGLVFALLITGPAHADCDGTGDTDAVGAEDCDSDGFAKMDGDCDDEDAAVNPGMAEDCASTDDENCDGFFDEGCERALQRGTLSGGSACGTTADEAWLLLLPLVFLRRRR